MIQQHEGIGRLNANNVVMINFDRYKNPNFGKQTRHIASFYNPSQEVICILLPLSLSLFLSPWLLCTQLLLKTFSTNLKILWIMLSNVRSLTLSIVMFPIAPSEMIQDPKVILPIHTCIIQQWISSLSSSIKPITSLIS